MTVSIITVNFNNAAGLQKTIESVVQQTYRHIEFIVIDGHSTDESKAVIERYQNNISYWVSEKDTGVFDAQNKGLNAATGNYVLVLNSGDELADENVLSDVFKNNRNEDIVYGNMIIVGQDGKRELGCMPNKISFKHMINDTLWHPVSFVKKEFLQKVGLYDLNYKLVADYEWFLKAIFKHKASMFYTNRTISVFYLGGMSSDDRNSIALKQERERAQVSVFGKEAMQEYHAQEAKLQSNLFYRIWRKMSS